MAKKKTKKLKMPVLRAVGAAAVMVALLFLGWLGWRWQATLPIHAIELTGTEHAARDSLLKLARVDTGHVLFDVEPDLVADRLRRHPWVESAEATRLPTGTLRLRVNERSPAVLALDTNGAPAYYLDAEGFQMPLDSAAVHDVPLMSGLGAPYQPVRPIASDAARALLAALAESALLKDGRVPYVSEVAFEEGEAWLYASSSGEDGRLVPVRLGASGFREQLRRLDAFWGQAVRPYPEKTFALIDLRFEGQIVARENATS